MNEVDGMRKGTCVKCGSEEVYTSKDSWNQHGGFESNTVPVTLFSQAVLENYVCADCGYVESYVHDQKKREKVREKWAKACEDSKSA